MTPFSASKRFDVIGTPPDDSNDIRTFVLVATTVFTIISTITTVLRFIARRKGALDLRADDWLILAGYTIALMPVICVYIQLQHGLGYHMYNLDAATKSVLFKANFALQRANQPALACIKISILFFYMRIFITRKFKYFAWANIVYTLLWAIIGWIVNILVCRPIQFFWDKTLVGGYCSSQQLSGALNGAFGALGDVLILCLPVIMVWQLQMNRRKKIAVNLIFLLGFFVCFASIYRIVVVSKAAPMDFTYAQAQPGVWTVIEMQAAIISANLPCLLPLFQSWFKIGSTGAGKYMGDPSSSKWSKGTGQQRSFGSAIAGSSNVHSNLDTGGFEILDDSDTGSRGDSTTNIELRNKPSILVKTEISAVGAHSPSHSMVQSMHQQTISGWLKQ